MNRIGAEKRKFEIETEVLLLKKELAILINISI